MLSTDEWSSFLIIITCIITYYIYYVIFVCKKPVLYGRKSSEFMQLYTNLSQILNEAYSPTIWCLGARMQSIIRIFLKKPQKVQFQRTILPLSDGGVVALDYVDNCDSEIHPDPHTRPTVILLPGLTGCSNSSYMRQMAKQVNLLGYRAVVFNQRGQGGAKLQTPQTYCATNYQDLTEVVQHVKSEHPDAPLMACGVSLGGMILFHYLAKMGAECPLDAAMVISAVWDVFNSTNSLESPINKVFLNMPLCGLLRNCVQKNQEVLNKKFDLQTVLRCSTIREFDTLLTAPMFGYRDVTEYYRSACLTPHVSRVKVPTLAFTAKDDPFVPNQTLPIEQCLHSDHVILLTTDKGGHIGFLEGLVPTGVNYMDRVFKDFVRIAMTNHKTMRRMKNQ